MTNVLILALLLASVPGGEPGLTNPARDPFQGPDQVRDEGPCPEPRGIHCIPWQSLKVTAIVTAPGGTLASFEAGNGESYFARAGDRVRNAVIVSIDTERRGVLLREPMPGTVAGFREIVLMTGAPQPIVREPMSAEPVLSASP